MRVESALVFQSGGRRLAVDMAALVGVAPADLTHIPLAEAGHRGLICHHGTVWPVFDPLHLLGLGEMRSRASLVVIVDVLGHGLGLICQRVEGAADVEGEPRALASGGTEVIVGGWPALLLDVHDDLPARLGGGWEAEVPATKSLD